MLYLKCIYRFSQKSQKSQFFKLKDGQIEKSEKQIRPLQYPKYDLNDTSPIIKRGRPIRYLSDKDQIPPQKLYPQDIFAKQTIHNNNWKSPQNSYALNIGLIGPVNSGKSELFGKLSHKVSAVSPKASTTTQIIQSIKSYAHQTEDQLKNVQLRYFDTPGMMYRKQGFVSKGWKVLSSIDFSLLVVDSAKRFNEMTKQSIRRLQRHRNYQNFMKALVLNKIDLVDNKRKFHGLISQIEKYGKFDKIFYVSAITGYGVKQLEEYLLNMSIKRQWEAPEEVKTNLTEIQVYEELIKQALFHRSYQQVPHDIRIQCIASVMSSDGIQTIKFKFTVRTENQQRMLIGKEGSNINNITNRFNVLFSQMFKRQSKCYVTINIADRYNKKNPGREQYYDDDISGIEEIKQRIKKTQQLLSKQNKLWK